jgi:hypothetical protein
MSLRTTYTGAYDTKVAQARQAGYDAILVTNLVTLTTAMTNAANKGLSTFTYDYVASYQSTDLRLQGNLWEAYKTGTLQALASENIMFNEVSVSLDLSDSIDTLVVLSFVF